MLYYIKVSDVRNQILLFFFLRQFRYLSWFQIKRNQIVLSLKLFPTQLKFINQVWFLIWTSLCILVKGFLESMSVIKFLNSLSLTNEGIVNCLSNKQDILLINNRQVHIHRVISSFTEGNTSTDKLIHADCNRPIVHLEGIAFSKDDFRCHVMWCPDDSWRPICDCLGCSEIDEFDISLV